MYSGYFSSFVFYFENICMKTRSLFLTSTSALAAYRLREVIMLCDIMIISKATSLVYFFSFFFLYDKKLQNVSSSKVFISKQMHNNFPVFCTPTACGLCISKHQSFSLLNVITLRSMRLSIHYPQLRGRIECLRKQILR